MFSILKYFNYLYLYFLFICNFQPLKLKAEFDTKSFLIINNFVLYYIFNIFFNIIFLPYLFLCLFLLKSLFFFFLHYNIL